MTDPKPTLTLHYCVGCRWLARAAWVAQELLTTFQDDLGGITLRPSQVGGTFDLTEGDTVLFSRKAHGGFCELKDLKQRVRDHIAPDRDLGHSDGQKSP